MLCLLLDTNSLIQNKLIVAHVLAHCDFFKNNIRFSNTKRDMVESMSATAERVKAYEHKYGKEEVETFLDAVLAIQEHIDPSLMRPKLAWSIDDLEEEEVEKKKASQYDDLWNLDNRNKSRNAPMYVKEENPTATRKDLLSLLKNIAVS